MTKQQFTLALIGNPNVGKTTVFNALTGSRQRVGNWSGVTVEKKEGFYQDDGCEVTVIDLPGIYSLSASTEDEKISRNYILHQHPDLLVNVVDAANLERNLYLTVQLIEMKVPFILVLTMLDIARSNQIQLDLDHLRRHLDCQVMPFRQNDPDAELHLKQLVAQACRKPQISALTVKLDDYTEHILEHLPGKVPISPMYAQYNERWVYLKLLEQDQEFSRELADAEKTVVEQSIKAIEKHRGEPCRNTITDDRYGFVHGLVVDVVKRRDRWRQTFSDKVDKVVLNSWLGLPIFLGIMFLVFSLTIKASQPLVKWIIIAADWLLVQQLSLLLSHLATPNWLTEFLSQGIGGGIGTVLSFTPPIFFIYVCLGWLEDSGYMSRAAFVADKLMRRIGLPGKAFIPLLVGFGCTVPAIMATRALDNRRDRIMASLLTPFMSCGAKLPVYTYLSLMFFPEKANLVVFSLYLIGIALALLSGLLLKKTVFRTKTAEFVMELPAYHLPTLNGVLIHTWHRLKDFILRAGKTILLVIALMYLLQMITVPTLSHQTARQPDSSESMPVTQLLGKVITPVFAPLGITSRNWEAAVALINGLFAKEAIVGSLQSLYPETANTPDQTISIREHFGNARTAFAYLLFILLYSPCLAALTLLWKEHGRIWLIVSFVYMNWLAWAIAVLYYQISGFMANPASALITIGLIVLSGGVMYLMLNLVGRMRKHVLS